MGVNHRLEVLAFLSVALALHTPPIPNIKTRQTQVGLLLAPHWGPGRFPGVGLTEFRAMVLLG